MNSLKVPSPIDLCNPRDAREWERTAQARPGRSDMFQAIGRELVGLGKENLSVLDLGSGPGFLATDILDALPDTLGQSGRRVARGADLPRAARQGRCHGVLHGCRWRKPHRAPLIEPCRCLKWRPPRRSSWATTTDGTSSVLRTPVSVRFFLESVVPKSRRDHLTIPNLAGIVELLTETRL